MDTTITILGPELLPESTIRKLALDGANLVPREGSDIYIDTNSVKLKKLLDDLIYTVNYNDLVGSHRASACNLLCTLIEKCSQSHFQRLHDLVWSHGIWLQAFDVFLNQHHVLNIKPSRQLMVSLISVLIKCSDSTIAKAAKITILQRLVEIICSTTEHVPIRPALQALAHILTKKFASIEDLYSAFCTKNESTSKSAETDMKLRSLLAVTLRWAPFDDFSSSAGLLASGMLESHRREHAQDKSQSPTFHSGRNASWSDTVLDLLSREPASLDNLRLYVFPELFKHDIQDYVAFLERLQIHRILGGTAQADEKSTDPLFTTQPEDVLFCALSVGSKIDLVQVAEAPSSLETNSTQLFFAGSSLCIPDRLLGSLLIRSSTKVRIAALSLLINATSTTKPLSHGSLQALERGLPYLHADSDSGFRSDFFSLVKTLTDRLRGATSHLAKQTTRGGGRKEVSKAKANAESNRNTENAPALLKAHKSFLEWYLAFLQVELRPTASYQRHISALKCISLIYRSGVDTSVSIRRFAKSTGAQLNLTSGQQAAWPFAVDVVNEVMADLLVDLLFDPFDDVRLAAAAVLSLVGNEATPNKTSPALTPRLLKALGKAERMMMLSGRADQADGVAHIYSIIFSRCPNKDSDSSKWWTSTMDIVEHLVTTLENTLSIAATDITKAVSKHPLHGLFISIRYILEQHDFFASMKTVPTAVLQALFIRIYKCLHQTWSCVHDILCNDAPEGFVPDDVDEQSDIGTKDVLSYSWRALKEASLVVRTVVRVCPLVRSEHPTMTAEQLQGMVDLSFSQLAELRHRGAFSTVSTTFAVCCMSCNKLSNSEGSVLENWYKRAVLCIQNQTTINTRRSAGLPSLMTGIIIADESRGVLFARAMHDLTEEAVKPVDKMVDQSGGLPQVHALNCLKDIFRNTKLGERSEPHVAVALGLAANCLSSDTWAVRNSGLMLFRALLDRLLGTNEAYNDDEDSSRSRLSYAAVPNLMEVVLKLLSPPADLFNDMATEGVFPALQLLQRAQPPAERREQISMAVYQLTSSPQWHIRDKAARTYATLVPRQARLKEAIRLLRDVRDSPNAIHGALLCSKYLMRRAGSQSQDLTQFSTAIESEINDLYHNNDCPFTQAAFVDIQTEYYTEKYQTGDNASSVSNKSPFDAKVGLDAVLELSQDVFAANSSLRLSLANLLISQIPSVHLERGNTAESIAIILKLAKRDPDACTTMLEQAKKLCTNSLRFLTLACRTLSEICTSVLFDSSATSDLEVRAAAQDLILALLASHQAGTVRGILMLKTDRLRLPLDNATPLFLDKRMVLQAALLEFRLSDEDPSDRSLAADLQAWTLTLGAALHEDNPFDTRLAAAQAACQVKQGLKSLRTSDTYHASFLSYALAVYDLTNDDDDDIRVMAASAACNILSTSAAVQDDLMPLAAASKLMIFLTQYFKSEHDLGVIAVGRLSSENVTARGTSSVRDIIHAATQQDMALFAQEKQNLFIDNSREARLWSQALVKLDSEVLPTPLITNLAYWTLDSIDALMETLGNKADGSLGWARRPEIFLLGLQLIYAAEVLLVVCGKTKLTVSGSDVREKLVRFLSIGRKSEVSPLWLSNAEKVLERSILRGVSKVGGLVSLVPGARPESVG